MRLWVPTMASVGQALMHKVQPMHQSSSITARVSGPSMPLAGLRSLAVCPVIAASRSISDSRFQLAAFHMGWLFPEPVRIFEVTGDTATEMQFSTDDFEYLNDLVKRVPEHAKLPGVAGFRPAR